MYFVLTSYTGLPERWLAMEGLHGKSIKVRILGSNRKMSTWENGIYEYKIACTLGSPVIGDPPAINVKLMSTPPKVLLVPLRFLVPVHPIAVKECAVVIAGDNLGKEVVVMDTKEHLWCLAPSDGPRRPLYTAPREHLAVRSKLRL
jgi:hypothetical protein